MSVELKLNSTNEAHIEDRHGHGNRDCQEDRDYRQIQDEGTVCEYQSQSERSQDGKTSSGGEYMTWKDHEDAHFLASVAHNTQVYGHDKAKGRKARPRRIPNPPLSFPEYRREHGWCWVCYGKGRSHKHDHKTCKVYEEGKRTYFQAHPEIVPKEKPMDGWKKRQAGGGRHVGAR